MKRPGTGWVSAVGLAAALACLCLAPPPAAAAAVSDADCQMCHGDKSLRSSADNRSLYVEPGAHAGSVHAKLSCAGCHSDVRELPHDNRLVRVSCTRCHTDQREAIRASAHGGAGARAEASCRNCHGTHDVRHVDKAGHAMCARCHEGAVREYDASLHAVAIRKGDPDASTCHDCHGSTHGVKSHLDPASPVHHDNLAKTCGRCHADRKLMAKRKITIPEAVQLFEKSVHGRAGNQKAASCNDCHESHRLKRATDPASSIYRLNIPNTCGKCHAKETEAYTVGVHGTALERGVTASPVCTDCHGEHLIRGPHDVDSPVSAAQVTETCSRCHEATGIRETFGLPTGRLDTYRDSFHGLAARGGSPVVANCASCHGYHDILPSTDPRSMVSQAKLGETCGSCHPGAGARFAMGSVHVAATDADQPMLFWARWIYLSLIAGTIGFMALHNGLDFARKIGASLGTHLGRAGSHAESHAATAGRWFVRMTLSERIQHFLLATSFFTLVYTGFALKYPESWLFTWLARLEGGYAWRSLVHRGAALVMVAVSLAHVAYLFTPRGRQLVRDLFPRIEDARDLVLHMLYLTGVRKAPARFDRFGYIEKAEYWALIWGTVVMTVTGFLLWFENPALERLPKWVLDLSTVVHYYEAWLAFLAIVVWHLYQNIVNPDVYPMNWTWFTGRIPEAQMRHEHAIEWERLTRVEPAGDSDAAVEPPAEGPAPKPAP